MTTQHNGETKYRQLCIGDTLNFTHTFNLAVPDSWNLHGPLTFAALLVIEPRWAEDYTETDETSESFSTTAITNVVYKEETPPSPSKEDVLLPPPIEGGIIIDL